MATKSSPQIKFNSHAIVLGRKRAGMTQIQLAKKLRVTGRTVQNWERGLEPSADNFRAILRVLDLSPEELYEEQAA